MKRLLGAVSMCLFGSIACADSGVLVDHVPGGAEPGVVISVVKQALVGRQWTIDAVDDSSVTASLNANPTDATIRISFVDGKLVYEGSSVSKTYVGPERLECREQVESPSDGSHISNATSR